MKGMTQRSGKWILGAGLGLAALSMLFAFVPNSLGQAGGAQKSDATVPRTADGHPDLTGRYRFAAGNAPQQSVAFKPGVKAKYLRPVKPGTCVMGGTPTTITMQTTQKGAIQLVQGPGFLWILSEDPQSVIWVPTDGRPHSDDPDVSFIGESVGRWDGDTLVVDTVAIDPKMRNVSVGLGGLANAWAHSDKEHVIQRFTRPSKSDLVYQVTVEDPVVLAKPYTSASMHLSLAGPDENWKQRVPRAGCDF